MSGAPYRCDAATPMAQWVAEQLGTRHLGSPTAPAAAAGSPGVGVRTASPKFPFDVLPADDVLDKLCVLLIDLDSVVDECVRVLQDCAAAALPPPPPPSPSPPSSSSAPHAAARPQRLQGSGSAFFSAPHRRAPPPTAPPAQLLDEQASRDAPDVPSFISVLHLFLEALCTVLRERKSQAELVLGDCADSLGRLNALHRTEPCLISTGYSSLAADAMSGSAGLMTPSALAGTEEVALWLQVHQAVVAFMWDRGADVLASTSLYVTAGSGWCGVMARYVHYTTKDAKTLAQQAYPVPCSTDPRAVFAPVGADAVMSLWSAWCAADVRARFTRHLAPAEGTAAAGLVRCLHLRHGPCVARRLGLQSCAHLPVLYALLAVCDACHVTATTRVFAVTDAVGADDTAAARQSLVTCAADLVNRYAGVLHVDLVAAWLAAVRAPSDAASLADGGDAADTATAGERCGAVPDLATALWLAHAATAEVTAASPLTGPVPLAPVWVGVSWRCTGPPRLWPALARLPPTAAPPAPPSSLSSSATRPRSDGEAAAPAARTAPAVTALAEALTQCPPSPPRLLSLSLALLPLRWCIARAVHGVFGPRAGLESCDGVDDAGAVAARMPGAFSLLGPPDYALADPHLGVADVAAALLEQRSQSRPTAATAEEGGKDKDGHHDSDAGAARAADLITRPAVATGAPSSSSSWRWFRSCLTRAAVDDVRKHVRPTAQLGVAAAVALWRARLWTCGEAVVFTVCYLRFLDASASGAADAADAAAAAGPAVESTHGEAGAGALVLTYYGVSAEHVEAWWHAVACLTVVHALASSVSQAAQVSATVAGGKAVPPRGLATLFAGCLPEAQYGAADRLALMSFLHRHGLLLRRDAAAAAAEEGGQLSSSSSPLPATALLPLMQALASPVALRDEVVHVHRILTALAPVSGVDGMED